MTGKRRFPQASKNDEAKTVPSPPRPADKPIDKPQANTKNPPRKDPVVNKETINVETGKDEPASPNRKEAVSGDVAKVEEKLFLSVMALKDAVRAMTSGHSSIEDDDIFNDVLI